MNRDCGIRHTTIVYFGEVGAAPVLELCLKVGGRVDSVAFVCHAPVEVVVAPLVRGVALAYIAGAL